MKRTSLILLTLALLAALAFAAYAALAWAGAALAWLDQRLGAPAIVAAMAAAWLVGRTMRRASERRAAARLAAERAATYQLFADVWGAVVAGDGGDEPDGVGCALDRLMALYAGPGALSAHLALRELQRAGGPGDPRLPLQLARALVAIRRDLGLPTRGLAAEDLAALFAPALPAAASEPVAAPASAAQDLRPRVSLAPKL